MQPCFYENRILFYVNTFWDLRDMIPLPSAIIRSLAVQNKYSGAAGRFWSLVSVF